MLDDKIIIEKQHKNAGRIIGRHILDSMERFRRKSTITISGESGSGKSETATALSEFLIVEGTYTSILSNVDRRIFIDRNFHQTLKHRQKRNRSSSELDDFTTQVLQKEHHIISKHRVLADIIINSDYSIVFKKHE